MEHGRSGRGKPNPPLRSLELHKIMPRGPGAIMLYREEIMGRICCMCKQQMSAIAEEEKSITCLCRDAAFHLTFSRNMLTFLCAFRLFFSEVALTHHNAEGNDAALQLSSRFSSHSVAISVLCWLYDSSFIVCIQIRANNSKGVNHASCSSCKNRVVAVWKFRS